MGYIGRATTSRPTLTVVIRVLLLLLIAYAAFVDTPSTWENITLLRDAQSHRFLTAPGDFAWYKGIKDALLLIILAVALGRRVTKMRMLSLRPAIAVTFLLLLGILGVDFVNSFFTYGKLVAALGLRAILPLLMFFIGLDFDENDFRWLATGVGMLAIAEALVGAVEYAIGQIFFGAGLGYRCTGTFFEPNNYALFGLAVIALLTLQDRSKLWYVYLISAFLIVLASGSRTGVTVSLIWLLAYVFLTTKKFLSRLAFSMILPALLLLVLYGADQWANRGSLSDNLDKNNDMRVGMLLDSFESSSWSEIILGRGLGIGSNALLVYAASGSVHVSSSALSALSDSLYTGVFTQGGLITVAAVLAFLLSPCLALKRREENHELYLLSRLMPLIILLAGFGIVATEGAPFNYIAFAIYGFLARSPSFKAFSTSSPSKAKFDGSQVVYSI